VVIAASAEPNSIPDMARKFTSFHTFDGHTYISYAEEEPRDVETFIENIRFKNQTATGGKLLTILPNAAIDSLIALRGNKKVGFHPPNLYFLKALLFPSDEAYRMVKLNNHLDYYYAQLLKDTREGFSLEYFHKKYKYGYLLDEIREYCQQNGKELVIVTIPDQETLMEAGEVNPVAQDLLHYAKAHKLKRFNGYKAFEMVAPEDLHPYFLPDMHWSQQGSDLFTSSFCYWITTTDPYLEE